MKRANWVLALCAVCGIFFAGTAAAVETYWELDGNAAAGWLGTTTVDPLTLKVNNTVGWRLLKSTGTPNVVGGYSGNTVSAIEGATIGGGGFGVNPNKVTGAFGTVAGGVKNSAGDRAAVAGGSSNTASGIRSAIGGGYNNMASGQYASVGGGSYNAAKANYTTVGGGSYNAAMADYATIAGGGPLDLGDPTTTNNRATDAYCTIGGGGMNLAGNDDLTPTNAPGVTVSGGQWNQASGSLAAIGGGFNNLVGGGYATVAGGMYNQVPGECGTVGGGRNNRAWGRYATVSGGGPDPADGSGGWVTNNEATDDYCTIGGGYDNQAGNGETSTTDKQYATVSGGRENTATGDSATIGGGYHNYASGMCATVPGGHDCSASGNYSFAAGHHAGVTGNGSFIWCDASSENWISLTTSNKFVARAANGVTFHTSGDLSSGVKVGAGGNAWESVCDRSRKENFKTVDAAEVLEKVATMPIATWNYKSEGTAIRHMGPVAQDMHAAFGLGNSDKTIVTIDADGVALAAIQGLNTKLEDQNRTQGAEIAALRGEIETLKSMIRQMAQE